MTFPGAPRLARGGIVLLDSTSSRVLQVIPLQYNPDTLSRTLAPQGIGGEPGDRLEALRLKGPPQETIKIDAELDATDQLEFPNANAQNRTVSQMGLFPRLAALEMLAYPPSAQLLNNDSQAASGQIEIAPVEAPLTLFVWSKNRVLPVHHPHARVRVEQRHRARHGVPAETEVVRREDADELTPRQAQALVVGADVALVLLMADETHARMVRVPRHDLRRVIRRRIVDQDHFEILEALLQQAVHRLHHKATLVVRRADEAHSRHGMAP